MAKMEKTCISNTKAYPIGDDIYRVVIPFGDSSSLEMLVQKISDNLQPCTIASSFIYNSISEDFRSHIKKLCK